MLAIWSLVPLPFLNLAYTSGSSWFTYCWSLTWQIMSTILLSCEMSAIVQQVEHSLACPSLGLEWKLIFSSTVATVEFPKLLVYWVHPAYLTYMQSSSWEMLDWRSTSWNQVARRNINNLRYADDMTLMAESKEELKSFLMKVKEESKKVGLKINIQKT